MGKVNKYSPAPLWFASHGKIFDFKPRDFVSHAEVDLPSFIDISMKGG
jgi:hypothetical protein